MTDERPDPEETEETNAFEDAMEGYDWGHGDD